MLIPPEVDEKISVGNLTNRM